MYKFSSKTLGKRTRIIYIGTQDMGELHTPGLPKSRKISRRAESDESDGVFDENEESNDDSEEDNPRAKGKKKKNLKATEKKRGLFREKPQSCCLIRKTITAGGARLHDYKFTCNPRRTSSCSRTRRARVSSSARQGRRHLRKHIRRGVQHDTARACHTPQGGRGLDKGFCI